MKLVRGLVDPKKVVYYREVRKKITGHILKYKQLKNCTKQNCNNVQRKATAISLRLSSVAPYL